MFSSLIPMVMLLLGWAMDRVSNSHRRILKNEAVANFMYHETE